MTTQAIILGGAASLWSDLERVGPWSGLVIGINDAGASFPGHLDHFVTLHPEKLDYWRGERERLGYNTDYETWTRRNPATRETYGADHIVKQWRNASGDSGGASGLLAVRVAIDDLGCQRVILCGVPMDRSPHFNDHETWGTGPWTDVDIHRDAWSDNLHKMEGRVYSMSGWTRELLGEPEWAASSP